MNLLQILSLTIFLYSSLSAFNQKEYNYLDQIALKCGADKGSNYHNYTEIYSQYFSDLKNQPIKFLEIGIDTGKSVMMWEKYFKKAELHFIDITFDRVKYFSKRSKYHLVDQQNSLALEQFIREYGEFDIILDDGGHTMEQQIISFLTLFPHIKKGGMYIIEDLHTSYWPSFGGGNHSSTTIEFLKKLIDDLNYVGNTTLRASHRNLDSNFSTNLNIFQKDIESMHFYDSTVIIKKRFNTNPRK
jgi:hypothetical protein